jgi:solute carrier family 35 protein E3
MSNSFPLSISLWIAGSIISSVGLILLNKVIMGPEFQFSYVFTLTSAHFLVTALGMEVLALFGFFTRSSLPLRDTIIMAVFCIGSVGFMNFSLKLNSVGFYQLTKLLCIPCMVTIQTMIYHQTLTKKIKFILLLILLGVGIATINDIQLNLQGTIMGALAVLFTSQFQIWQGEKQKNFSLNPMQMNHAQGLPSFLFCLLLAVSFESSGSSPKTNVLLHEFHPQELSYIFLSCILALSVNLCTYGLIGKTSPVTYQVVGHAKTILVLIGGFLMEASAKTAQSTPGADQSNSNRNEKELFETLIGIALAMVGVIVYGHVRYFDGMNPRPEDILDKTLPAWIMGLLRDNHKHGGESVEMRSSPVDSSSQAEKGQYIRVKQETDE